MAYDIILRLAFSTPQLTKWGAARKEKMEDGYKEGGQRGATQVRV